MEPLDLRVNNIGKSFKGQQVLKDVSLTMTGGHIYGLVGRNGSGKTVLLKMLCGFMAPDAGTITIQGKAVICGRALPVPFGVVFDSAGFVGGMSGLKNLTLLAGIRGNISKAQVRWAMERVGLDPANKKKVAAYSLGMRQRLAFAQAFMENPDILLFDEPMNGLDASAVAFARDMMLNERDKGKLVIVATHVREDIRLLCDQVFQVANGTIEDAYPGLPPAMRE